jgi:hypothetical protein
MDSAVNCERVGHGASRSSTETNQHVNQAKHCAAEHDGHDVPFPSEHSDKCDCAYDDGKPIDVSVTRENDVQSKPESQIQIAPLIAAATVESADDRDLIPRA